MERVLSNKANYLANNGYDVGVITTDQKEKLPYFFMDPRIIQHDLGINYSDNEGKSLWRKVLSYVLKQKQHRKKLTAILKEWQADIVISMFDHEVTLLHQIEDGSSKVLEIHFSRFKRLQYDKKGVWALVNKWRSWQDLRLAKRYDKFVVLTEEDRNYWGQLRNLAVIPNSNSFETVETAVLKNKRAIAVGRFDYQKGFDELIQIWQKIQNSYPGWCLDIVGEGPLEASYSLMIEKLGLQNAVFLRPPEKDIKKTYLKYSFLVMTSRYEGFGMVLTEAQVCGLPVIAYACKCGPRDIIVDGVNGFLIEDRDGQKMESRIAQLIDDELLREDMGVLGKMMSSRFSEKQVMLRWSDLFNNIVANSVNSKNRRR
ncbi:glycosyltransferase family 4 protein [Sphingobacterium sp. SYP-B4668]|uniref:glycosyltransferase family 4 protein n=1 Tax=Sphingobacterium sp. SYP-B4668 TaxID=2996035 RepID=UPI0022DDDC31|nr:glycosyltransferase family 4 protein [Sphingobacterium sp. SYP-B4668]